MELLSRLRDLRGAYDAVFCDLWGVVHDGRTAFQPALAALVEFRALGGRVVLISNVPKPRGPIPRQLDRLGVPHGAWDAIVTSGDAVRAELAARAPGPAHLFGPRTDGVLWEGLGLELAPLSEARFLLATGLDDFERETPADYAERLAGARERDLELVSANPDVVVRFGGELYWCAGALARDYAALGGRVVEAGKPHAPIYKLAFAELETLLGRPPERSRVLAIGDGPATDILGANRQGLDALFIAAGIHGDELHSSGRLDLAAAAARLAEAGTHARYIAPELA